MPSETSANGVDAESNGGSPEIGGREAKLRSSDVQVVISDSDSKSRSKSKEIKFNREAVDLLINLPPVSRAKTAPIGKPKCLPEDLPDLGRSASKPTTKGDGLRYIQILVDAQRKNNEIPFDEEDNVGRLLHFQRRMILMGFSPEAAEKALKQTGVESIEAAVAPLVENIEQNHDKTDIPDEKYKEEHKERMQAIFERLKLGKTDQKNSPILVAKMLPQLQKSFSSPPTPKDHWECKICTFFNENKLDQCAMCEHKKDSKKPELRGDEILCGICWDSVSPDQIRETKCSHNYCKECWSGYLTAKIQDGKVMELVCPEPSCACQVAENEIHECVSEDILTKYKKFRTNTEVALDKKKRWCPTRDCNTILERKGNARKVVCPTCDRATCWNCNSRYHRGTCAKKAKTSNEAAFMLYKIRKNVKACPRCRVPVEKISGCNHMTCYACNYEWCWMCGGKYTHDHFEPYNLFGCPGGQNSNWTWLQDDTCCCINFNCCSIDCGCECIGFPLI